MAAELGNLISEHLKSLPKNHKDKWFIEGELLNVRRYQLREELYSLSISGVDVKETKDIIKKYISLAYDDHAHELHRKPWAGHLDHSSPSSAKYNAEIRKEEMRKYGGESIASLIPSDSSLFARMTNYFFKRNIHTREELDIAVNKNRLQLHSRQYGFTILDNAKPLSDLEHDFKFALWHLACVERNKKSKNFQKILGSNL